MATRGEKDQIAEAILRVFESPNETDRNYEPANVVDAMYTLARAISELADALRRVDKTLS